MITNIAAELRNTEYNQWLNFVRISNRLLVCVLLSESTDAKDMAISEASMKLERGVYNES